jgi:hypothetical protein
MPAMTQTGPALALPLEELIEVEVSYYRSLKTELGELLADHILDLANRVRQVSDGPIAIGEFLGRWEVVEADRRRDLEYAAEMRGWERGHAEAGN